METDIQDLMAWQKDAERELSREAERLEEKGQRIGGLMKVLEATEEILAENSSLREELERKDCEIDALREELEGDGISARGAGAEGEGDGRIEAPAAGGQQPAPGVRQPRTDDGDTQPLRGGQQFAGVQRKGDGQVHLSQ